MVVDTVSTNPLIHTQSYAVVHMVNIFMFLRILSGPVLFAVLTTCGIIAARRTSQGRPPRNLFAGIFATLLVLLLLIGPRLLHVSPGATYLWGSAALHMLANVLILLAAARLPGSHALDPTESELEGMTEQPTMRPEAAHIVTNLLLRPRP